MTSEGRDIIRSNWEWNKRRGRGKGKEKRETLGLSNAFESPLSFPDKNTEAARNIKNAASSLFIKKVCCGASLSLSLSLSVASQQRQAVNIHILVEAQAQARPLH